MTKYSLKIFEMKIMDDKLRIGLRLRGDYDPTVRNPRIIMKFTDGVETRRLPLLIQAYYPSTDMQKFTIFASYKYKINNLFFNNRNPEHIRCSIEFTYGNNVTDDMKMKLSSDLNIENSELFEVDIEQDKKHFDIHAVEGAEEKKGLKFLKPVKWIIYKLWKLVLIVVAICLLPLFMVEALLAMLGIFPNAPKNNKQGLLRYVFHVRWRFNFIIRSYLGFGDIKNKMANLGFFFGSLRPVNKNHVTFISNRRNDLSGNFQYIYDALKAKDTKLKINTILDEKDGYTSCFKYGYALATSKVILVDDYVKPVYAVKRRPGTYLIQVWHACGAFKTFGFSRLGKAGGQKQDSYDHRNYDYCTVSSKEISKFYAEGFGLSDEKAVATGVPRTDIFFDEKYKKECRDRFYSEFPDLKDKKIILFAPTFRGNGKKSGNYPDDRFDPVNLYNDLKGEYAIIIKHHPFVQNRPEIPEEYKNVIIDMSDNAELNDLLFITDILITDYSSVIFEASLLDIPMLFYAFDLQRYISTRGFYYEFEKFVPGKIVNSMAKLEDAIVNQDFEAEKIGPFKKKFFDDLDGRSAYRVAELIENLSKK